MDDEKTIAGAIVWRWVRVPEERWEGTTADGYDMRVRCRRSRTGTRWAVEVREPVAGILTHGTWHQRPDPAQAEALAIVRRLRGGAA